MENYQIGSGLLHSVDQNPGGPGNRCKVSGARVKVSGGWGPTNLQTGVVMVFDVDKNGSLLPLTTSHEWDYSLTGTQTFEIWDKVMAH